MRANIDGLTMDVLTRFQIASFVPVDGQATYEEISEASGINVVNLRRIMRYAMTNYIFREPVAGVVVHTASSQLMAEDELTKNALVTMSSEGFGAAAKTAEAMSLHPNSDEPALSGWGLANEAVYPLYEELARHHPERALAVADSMDAYNSWIPIEPLLDNYDWASLGQATVVDVGGCHGPVSKAIAKRFPNLRFIVQDLPGPVAKGIAQVPAELTSRVSFMEHDFFTEQRVRGADVYFFRAIFHDWPDKYCIRILRQLIPALRRGSRIIVNEFSADERGQLPQTV